MLNLPSGKKLTLKLDLPPVWRFPFFNLKPGFFLASLPEGLENLGNSVFLNALNDQQFQEPLPKNLNDIKRFVQIEITGEFGDLLWGPIPMVEFHPEEFLSNEDCKVWKIWSESEPVQIQLEMYIDQCYRQVEENNQKDQESYDEKTINHQIGSRNKNKAEENYKRHLPELCDRDYLNQLKKMEFSEDFVDTLWVKLLLQLFSSLHASGEGETFFKERYNRETSKDIYRVSYLNCLLNQKKFAEVEEEVWDEVAISPHKTEYWSLLVRVFLDQDRFEETYHIIDLGLSKNPENESLKSWRFLTEKICRVSEKIRQEKRARKTYNPKRKHMRKPPDNRHNRILLSPKNHHH